MTGTEISPGMAPSSQSQSRPHGQADAELLLCVLPWPESDSVAELEQIKQDNPRLEVQYIKTKSFGAPADVPQELYQRANVLATGSWLPSNAAAAPRLDAIQVFSAGVNHISQHPIFTDSEIRIASANGVHGPQIAEWVIMMNLIFSHGYPPLYEAQRRCEWARQQAVQPRDSVGQRVGVLGYGSIGRQVARVCNSMGMDVIAYTASPRPTPESRRDSGFVVPGTGDLDGTIPSAWFSGTDRASLHRFLKQGLDLLVVSVPLTHFLSTPEFDLLAASNRHGTLIANIARGKVVDQPALVAALEAGKLRGAVLDVTDPEPLPADDALWRAPRTLITPHVSGLSVVNAPRTFQLVRENLKRRARGQRLINEVDRRRGY